MGVLLYYLVKVALPQDQNETTSLIETKHNLQFGLNSLFDCYQLLSRKNWLLTGSQERVKMDAMFCSLLAVVISKVLPLLSIFVMYMSE